MKSSFWFLMLAAITYFVKNSQEITGSLEVYSAQQKLKPRGFEWRYNSLKNRE